MHKISLNVLNAETKHNFIKICKVFQPYAMYVKQRRKICILDAL